MSGTPHIPVIEICEERLGDTCCCCGERDGTIRSLSFVRRERDLPGHANGTRVALCLACRSSTMRALGRELAANGTDLRAAFLAGVDWAEGWLDAPEEMAIEAADDYARAKEADRAG